MDCALLQDVYLETARRLLIGPFTYQRLVPERMGEAEIRNVLARVLEEKQQQYAIEVATGEPYIHKNGRETRKALVDLVTYTATPNGNESVYIELKRGHPPISNIIKDINKMISEGKYLVGASFFHYLHKADYGSDNRSLRTRSNILKKYQDALTEANGIRPKNRILSSKRWFYCFILDGSSHKYACGYVDGMDQELCFPNGWLELT